MDDQQEFQSLWKPKRGTALLESRERSAKRRAAEQKIMQQAKRRDGNVCRRPFCPHKSKDLPIDPCHQRHRGMGGNPKCDRTTTDTLMSMCRADHGAYDAGELDWEAQTDQGANGPVDWYLKNPETGRMELFASETTIGVSVAVGA